MASIDVPKPEIKIILRGPYFTCRDCKSILEIPKDYPFEEDSYVDRFYMSGCGSQDAIAFYHCPVCGERNNAYRISYNWKSHTEYVGKDYSLYESD
jgi:hypothetical protein